MAAPRLHLGSSLRVERGAMSSISSTDDEGELGSNHIKMSAQTTPVVHATVHGQIERAAVPLMASVDGEDVDGDQFEGDQLPQGASKNSTIDVPSSSNNGQEASAGGGQGDGPSGAMERQQSVGFEESTSHKIRSSRRKSRLYSRQASASGAFIEEETLKRDLRFFFLDPVEKWHVRKRFPWKLLLQILKIITVTAQIIMFGDMRMSHVDFIDQTLSSLRHFMLKNWEDGRDVHTYPPSLPPFSIYNVDDFYDQMTFAVKQYYKLNSSGFGIWMYNHVTANESSIPPLTFCIREFRIIEFYPLNNSYYLDTAERLHCTSIDVNDTAIESFSMKDYLEDKNLTINHTRFIMAYLSFGLNCVHLRKNQVKSYLPDCFRMLVNITFDNTKHTGKVLVDLKNTLQYLSCDGSVLYADFPVSFKVSMGLVDIAVMFICYFSLILCFRALIRADKLKRRTRDYFLNVHHVKLTKDEELMFLNGWYIFILLNDVFLIIGIICKFTIEYKILGSVLFTFTGMLLGLGTLFAWVGILRYFGFFSNYNILILTLKRAFPNVIRFMVCAGLIYLGFMFCGWIIIGPYHMKFRDLMTTSECLFALINGDDMFATFTTTSEDSPSVVWFARIYLYVFISLFIYIVLSLFISIIMDAYEVVKDRYSVTPDDSVLKNFIAKCEDASSFRRPKKGPCTRCCQSGYKKLMSKIFPDRFSRSQDYSDLEEESDQERAPTAVIT